jgi:hypothetical protein
MTTYSSNDSLAVFSQTIEIKLFADPAIASTSGSVAKLLKLPLYSVAAKPFSNVLCGRCRQNL